MSFEIIRDGKNLQFDESIQKKFKIIDRNISRISYQMNNVLEYVKEQKTELVPSNISNIIKYASASITIPKDVKIYFDLKDLEVNCDAPQMEVVITNLLTNAISAINEKGTIKIRVKDDQNNVIIEVEDSGPGIPDNIGMKIFEPLFTTKQIGTGLGLASCQKIIEAHKGSISYRNNPTTFTVKIPKDSPQSDRS